MLADADGFDSGGLRVLPQDRNRFPQARIRVPEPGISVPLAHHRIPIVRSCVPYDDLAIPDDSNAIPHNDNPIPDNDNASGAKFPVIGGAGRGKAIPVDRPEAHEVTEFSEEVRHARLAAWRTDGIPCFSQRRKRKTGSRTTTSSATRHGSVPARGGADGAAFPLSEAHAAA